MIIKKITSLALILVSSAVFAQDTIVATAIKKEPLTRREVLDSIKATFVQDNIEGQFSLPNESEWWVWQMEQMGSWKYVLRHKDSAHRFIMW